VAEGGTVPNELACGKEHEAPKGFAGWKELYGIKFEFRRGLCDAEKQSPSAQLKLHLEECSEAAKPGSKKEQADEIHPPAWQLSRIIRRVHSNRP
jgi:hypothetical protein